VSETTAQIFLNEGASVRDFVLSQPQLLSKESLDDDLRQRLFL
jgi:hypothetical protein